MDRKPKVFQNDISKKINNNRTCSITRSSEVYNNIDINTKINDILNDHNFIYKAQVIIKINGTSMEKEIIAKKGSNLVTIDNELIPIKDIEDIYRKN